MRHVFVIAAFFAFPVCADAEDLLSQQKICVEHRIPINRYGPRTLNGPEYDDPDIAAACEIVKQKSQAATAAPTPISTATPTPAPTVDQAAKKTADLNALRTLMRQP